MKSPILVIDDSMVTVPLPDDAQGVLRRFFLDHGDELDAALAPYGIQRHDILVPTFERLVREDEVRGLTDHTIRSDVR